VGVIDWAKELGIDVDVLRRESPTHRSQIDLRNRLEDKAEKFWAWNRFVDSTEYGAGLIYLNVNGANIPKDRVRVVKNAKKRAKVNRYEFTDAQLQIARRSLDAQGSV
jgi:hypothetical protein